MLQHRRISWIVHHSLEEQRIRIEDIVMSKKITKSQIRELIREYTAPNPGSNVPTLYEIQQLRDRWDHFSEGMEDMVMAMWGMAGPPEWYDTEEAVESLFDQLTRAAEGGSGAPTR